jgi:hypothetical protein
VLRGSVEIRSKILISKILRSTQSLEADLRGCTAFNRSAEKSDKKGFKEKGEDKKK